MHNSAYTSTLNRYFEQIEAIILDKQHPVTGLLPASTAVNTHGDYTDAWVRDNVYSILAVWGLALAYRRVDDDGGRGYELEQRTVKLMRGLLRSMMQQAGKVEQFKRTQAPIDALHAKYDTDTGNVVVGDLDWGHLQIDATSVFLLTMAQMISSGLDIVWTLDEVNFVQNLVFYIERAYRTPDYGIWERGGKMNRGSVELNASSLGMAKAALEAMSGFNLFGAKGSQASVIHVIPDNIAQSDITLSSMLPRESVTKEVDAALLSVISYPAFAIHDADLVEKTRNEIVWKLEGNYGLKRFLRDGHQTVLEDEHRLHYEPEELKQFEDIESEWPLFYTYLYLDGLFRGNEAQAEKYERKLEEVLVMRNGQQLLPELYFVPKETIWVEKDAPHTQDRLPNENVPLVWAQSLYLLGRLIRDDLLQVGEIDPLGRRYGSVPRYPVVQLVLLAEDKELQAELATHGVMTETLEELEPVVVRYPDEIAAVYEQVGRNDKLGLGGRVNRGMKSLTTSRLYRLRGETNVCLTPNFIQQEFYLTFDLNYLIQRFKSELAYVHRHWTEPGRPTVTILLTHELLDVDPDTFYLLMQAVRTGYVDGIPIMTGRLAQLLPTASFERIDELHDLEFGKQYRRSYGETLPILPLHVGDNVPLSKQDEIAIDIERDVRVLATRLERSTNLFEQIEILAAIGRQSGINTLITIHKQKVPLRDALEEVYSEAGRQRLWAVVRRAAGLLDKFDVDASFAVGALLVSQKQVQVGQSYSEDSVIVRPIPPDELHRRITQYCRDDNRNRVLTQELLIYLGVLIKARPELFTEMLTVRVSHMIVLLTGQLAADFGTTSDEAYEQMMNLAPSEIQQKLQIVLEQYQSLDAIAWELETLHAEDTGDDLTWEEDPSLRKLRPSEAGWITWRQRNGILTRNSAAFYQRVWKLFEHTQGIVIGDKLDRRNRLDSKMVLSDMTQGEQAFMLLIEHLLNKIEAPQYRQLNLEAVTVVSEFFNQNPSLRINDHLVFDVVIGHAVRLAYLHRHPDREAAYSDHKVDAWDSFYRRSPAETSNYIAYSLQYLLTVADV